MILTFHGKPLASGQGLCDMDRVWTILYGSDLLRKKLKTSFTIRRKIGFIPPCQDSPFFWKLD